MRVNSEEKNSIITFLCFNMEFSTIFHYYLNVADFADDAATADQFYARHRCR